MTKDEGIDAVRRAYLKWVRWVAHSVIPALAVAQRFITTDDIWRVISESARISHVELPAERRAMGPAVTEAAKWGYITKTAATLKSSREVAHDNPKQVWQSCMYKGTPLVVPRYPDDGTPSPGPETGQASLFQ